MIFEVTEDGRRIPIHLPRCNATSRANEVVNAQVDRTSRIEVRFDRRILIDSTNSLGNLEIMVRASLHGDGANQNLEVPNYALVGENKQPATASIASREYIGGMIGGLRRSRASVGLRVNAMNQGAYAAQIGQAERRERQLLQERRRSQAVESQLNGVRSQIALLRASDSTLVARELSETAPDSGQRALREQQRRTVQEQLSVLMERETDLEGELRSLATSIEQTEDNLLRLRADSAFSAARAAHSRQAARALLGSEAVLTSPLKVIGDSANLRLISAVTDPDSASPEQVMQAARDVTDRWFPLLDDSLSDSERRDVIDRINESLDFIESAIDPRRDAQVSLISAIKDTDILLESEGAKVGQTLAMTVINQEDDPTERRDLVVRLRIADLGWEPSVGEAFTLMNRNGSPSASENQRDIDAFRQRFAARQLHETLTTADSVMRVQLRSRWVPSYSFTSGWVYRARAANPLTDSTSRWRRGWHNTMHWLQPSVGIQVGLPKFGAQDVTFSRTVTVEQRTRDDGTVFQDTTFTVGEPKIDDVNRGIDVAMGGYLGAWNNMVVFGGGMHLTADRPRWYTSIGVSFVRIAQTAISSLGQ